ncbi:MAG: hypothetical protein ABEJ95_00770 [Candidatus Nanohalobium sp.]
MKGQSSVEFTMIMGMALVLASPFVLSAQTSVVDMKDASDYLQLKRSMDELKIAAQELNQSMYPARRNLDFTTPEDVTGVYSKDLPDGSALIFETYSQGAYENRSMVFRFDLEVNSFGNITRVGIHRVRLRTASNAVNMSVVS